MAKFDEVNYWSEIKLEIIRDYAKAYSTILSAQKRPQFHHVYVDAFAGAGVHLSKTSGEFIPGSPLNALQVEPPFREYHFIDLDGDKVANLKKLIGNRQDVHVHEGDCNKILLEKIFPRMKYENYRRGLCLLDPYGLDLDWKVIAQAGKMKSVDIFLNFPIMDMNRNALWNNPKNVDPSSVVRMNQFWGDDSWRTAAYKTQETLFGPEEEKTSNAEVVQAFRERLKKIAGFRNVPEPIPMRNSREAVVYYLFFASQKPVASNIIQAIFKKYKGKGVH